MRFSLFLVFISFILFSCSRVHEAGIKSIDSLLVELDSARIRLYKLDTGKVYRHIRQIENEVKTVVSQGKAVTKENALILEKYNNARKGYSKFAERFPILFEEIETIPAQLRNLRSDLSKNLIEKEEAVLYLSKEIMAATALIQTIEGIESGIVRMDALFDESKEKVLHLIQSADTLKKEEPAS